MQYEFVCPTCKHETTEVMTLGAYSLMQEMGTKLVCSVCQGSMRRKYSPPGISIK